MPDKCCSGVVAVYVYEIVSFPEPVEVSQGLLEADSPLGADVERVVTGQFPLGVHGVEGEG